MIANNRQVGGDHYRKGRNGVQHWDLAASQEYDYFQGQVTKYVDRWKRKNGIVDLEKALHFLEKYIEVEKYKLEDKANRQETQQNNPDYRNASLPSSRLGMYAPFGYNPEIDS